MTDNLPTTFDAPVRIAIIGGTGISSLSREGYTPLANLTVTTPWGTPSSPILILQTPHGTPIAFLARHGSHHEFTPSEVPNRANIAALRKIGVRTIIAFSAVGSLREEIRPRDFVIPDQVIDRTKGIRPFTFFEGGLVSHVGFAEPFDSKVRAIVHKAGVEGVLQGGARLFEDGLLICMEGPQFSTRAESNLYRSWGGDVINMSALPEAKLAREAEIAYSMVCMATDYDCWRIGEEAVDVPAVMAHMKANAENARHLMAAVIEELQKEEYKDVVEAKHLVEGSKWGCSTADAGKSKEALEKLEWLLPGYFTPASQ
ncbi:putative 5'-methylthioadenosine phosphorylase [Ascobolus immersus RN42]|uniref:S-methyl-5'-thioadenosine phosphorylase n=1 Tax=Ascobolus immersus RN42 TaxID=1160509 RepID=A0A3N4HCI3_ASCIM|nr:putative 5'-methylthioadenosine phosphorylase [Ascobolus immersus RN42]